MLKIIPALEGFVLANIATQGLFNSNPLAFVLGDLNSTVGSSNPNALQLAMGPNHQGISLKELLTNSMSTSTYKAGMKGAAGQYVTGTTGGVLDVVQQNFMNNMGNIIVGTAMSTAGFRIAKKVLRKPINMANRSLRQFGMGSTIQF